MLALGSLLWSSDMNHHEISASEPSSLHQDSHSSRSSSLSKEVSCLEEKAPDFLKEQARTVNDQLERLSKQFPLTREDIDALETHLKGDPKTPWRNFIDPYIQGCLDDARTLLSKPYHQFVSDGSLYKRRGSIGILATFLGSKQWPEYSEGANLSTKMKLFMARLGHAQVLYGLPNFFSEEVITEDDENLFQTLALQLNDPTAQSLKDVLETEGILPKSDL